MTRPRTFQESLNYNDDDPLTRAIAPPPNESPVERETRLAAEMAALKRSQAIDEELNRQRINDKKMRCVRVLLLGMSSRPRPPLFPQLSSLQGQSESGMSTSCHNLWTSLTPFKANQPLSKVRCALDFFQSSFDMWPSKDFQLFHSSKVQPTCVRSIIC